MKYFKILIFSISFLVAGAALTSCGSSAASDAKGKEYTSAYICPMHCEGSGSDAEGTCPVCKMDYVKNDNHNQDG